jgi:SRSO17 transposase
VGKTDNGIVAVTSLWADERVYWPVHVQPYTPGARLPKGRRDPGFRTKPQQAAELVAAARTAQIPFRAVVADCFYGDNDGFTEALGRTKVAYVLAVKPRKGAWAPADEVHTPQEAARQLAWGSPEQPGDWTRSPAASAMGMSRPGGRPTPRCPRRAGVRAGASGWWW